MYMFFTEELRALHSHKAALLHHQFGFKPTCKFYSLRFETKKTGCSLDTFVEATNITYYFHCFQRMCDMQCPLRIAATAPSDAADIYGVKKRDSVFLQL